MKLILMRIHWLDEKSIAHKALGVSLVALWQLSNKTSRSNNVIDSYEAAPSVISNKKTKIV